MKGNRIFGRKRYHRALLIGIILFLVVMIGAYFAQKSHAQTQPKKLAVWFDTPGSQVSSNGLQQALQVRLGDGVEVLAYTTQRDDFHAVLRFVRADVTGLNQVSPSAWRSGLGSGAIVLMQVFGQKVSSAASANGGIFGQAAGATISTGTNQASQGVYKNIVYKRHMEAGVPLYYAFCSAGKSSLRLECTGQVMVWYRIRQDNDPASGQSRWLLLGYGPTKDQVKNFPKDEAVYLYEGAGGFYRQDLLQELLLRFLLEEADLGKTTLVGASQLKKFIAAVDEKLSQAQTSIQPVTDASKSVVAAPASTPRDAETERRMQVAASLGNGNMVPMHPQQVQEKLQQLRRCTRDELVQDATTGNWVCPPQAASAAPVVSAQPSIAAGMDKDGEQPFSRIVQFVFGKDDMAGHDVELMINLLRNKGYLTVPSTRTWNQFAAADWKRMEEAFVAIGAPLTADGRLTVTEFAYWRDVLAKYPNDFAPPIRR